MAMLLGGPVDKLTNLPVTQNDPAGMCRLASPPLRVMVLVLVTSRSRLDLERSPELFAVQELKRALLDLG